ncbi:unnamed protein product [Allacma fusca]|uniref:Major facilitator superfamily (MFS) profile domain-containing protein n=1 Tax=Allacma fusca TaxID=39272 RepID=A0A8J2KY56_9HEXA|nr:unnamed protein product [Allacma fusca]
MAKEIKGSSSTGPQNIEDALEALGGFGKFQALVLFLILFMELPTAMLIFLPVFIGKNPSEWLCDNVTVTKTEACECMGNVTPVDDSVSIVAEWNLICESSWVSDTIVTVQMSGMILGKILASQACDWYGRKKSFVGVLVLMTLGSITTAVAPNPYVYGGARFVCGASFSGFLGITSVYSMEFLTPGWRAWSSGLSPMGIGIMTLGILAYLIRTWRTLVWATLLPFFGIVFILPFLPESPRWLLRNNKITEGHKVFNYIARLNNRDPLDIETLRCIAEKERPKTLENSNEEVKQFSYLDFFRNKQLLKTTLCLQCVWFTCGLVYFGISFNIKNLSGDPYMNVVYMGLMDFIGYPGSSFLLMKLSRRKSLVALMSLSAVFLVAMAILQITLEMSNYKYILAILCFLGKLSIGGARCVLRVFSGESFPTAIRSMGLGVSSGAISFGGMLAPQLAYLGDSSPSLPFFVFAVVSVLGSLVSFLLAESDGKPLQEEVRTKQASHKKPEVITVASVC